MEVWELSLFLGSDSLLKPYSKVYLWRPETSVCSSAQIPYLIDVNIFALTNGFVKNYDLDYHTAGLDYQYSALSTLAHAIYFSEFGGNINDSYCKKIDFGLLFALRFRYIHGYIEL